MNEKDSMMATYEEEVKRALTNKFGHPINITTALSPTGEYDCLNEGDNHCNVTPYIAALNIMDKFIGQIKDNGITGYQKGELINILERLINDKPLTPIEDEPDMWVEVSPEDEPEDEPDEKTAKVYQCKRYPPLFKIVSNIGTVKYNDVRRFVVKNISTTENDRHPWTYLRDFKLVSNIMDGCHPITLPYTPETNPIRISYIAFHHKPDMSNIEWRDKIDTIGISDPIDEHPIFFQEVPGVNGYGWEKITEEDYELRMNSSILEMLKVIKINAIYYHEGSDGFVEIVNDKEYTDIEYKCIGDTTGTIKRAPRVDFADKYIWEYLGMDFADVIARIYEADALNSFIIPDYQKDYLRKTYPQYVGPHTVEPYYK